jgi:hypothetical protein
MPASTSKVLKVCCVPLAAFSPVDSSDQWYLPSSEVTVIERRREVAEEGYDELFVEEVLVWEAALVCLWLLCAGWVESRRARHARWKACADSFDDMAAAARTC